GIQQDFTVPTDPGANGAEAGTGGQFLAREINRGLVRFEIDIAKSHDPLDRLFENLSAPTGLRASVIAFPPFEAELFQRAHEIDKMFARRAEGMVIVIGPAESQSVLAR